MKKTIKETLGFNDKWLMIIGIPITTVVINIIMFSSYIVSDPRVFLFKCLPLGLVYTTVSWLALRPVIVLLMKKYPYNGQVLKRFFLQVVCGIVGYIIIKFLLDSVFKSSWFSFFPITYPTPYTDLIAGLLFLFLILAIYESIVFYTKLQKSLQENERLQRENIQSQLDGLKSQVNPHFLFNSLNTLSHLIPENPDRAVNFVQKLSKVYRYILEIRDEKIILLSDELEFCHSYIFLLKERFGDNLQINCEIAEPYLNKKIVPLSLQILFENAIKHNIISKNKPLTIDVYIADDENKSAKLIVKNNLQKKNQVASSTKMGLQNIKNRYQFFTDQPVDVIVTAESFIVALPLVKRISNEKQKYFKTIKV